MFSGKDLIKLIESFLNLKAKTLEETLAEGRRKEMKLTRKVIKGGFPVMAEITGILAAKIRRQFFLLSPMQRVIAAWFKIFNYSLFHGFWHGFRHNRIVQSPHENYFNICRQHKEK